MIETTIPELDVAELMQRVRVEAAKIAERTSGRPRASNDAPNLMPPVQVLPPPPASMPIRPVNLKRDRLDHLLRQARQNTEVASWIPKPLRGLFRKQGGFNRHVLETITSLVKTNSELVNRVRDLSTSLQGQAQWLNVLADRRAADGAWMRGA
ncbi:MAG TPA: hypothetical protein VK993_12810, partial [Chthoniobacterales bacterium]|nr:hypothetical protein [Chthoniobacterales bacterium]